MAYSTVAEVRVSLGNIVVAAIPNETIDDAIEAADSLIDSYIASRYTVPITVSPVPYMIRRLSRDIAVTHVFNDAVASGTVPQDDRAVEFRYRAAIRTLEHINKGLIQIIGATAAASSSSKIYSNTSSYVPVFNVDDPTRWGVDSDLLEEVEDERDSAESKLPTP